MPRPSATLGLLALDRRRGEPLQEQIYRRVREDILAGRLVSGTRLPPSRTLAGDLGVARNTVVATYERLEHEGYVTSRVGSGTCVAALPPDALLAARAPGPAAGGAGSPARLSRRGRAFAGARRPLPDPAVRAFQPGLPEVRDFPHALWARLLQRHARRPPRGELGYAYGVGLPALREAIAQHVGSTRGVVCTAEQVLVVAGAQAGLDLVCRLLLDPGDAAWIEEPGYLGARGALLGAGARLVPVRVDAEGIDVAAGVRRAPRARLAYTTPSHQFPLGATMSLARRLALLDWAAQAGAWVIEDDYDSEYRYAGRPLPAMQGLDAGGRVIYVGTFSKTMFPALRVGWLVVPPALAGPLAAAMRNTGHGAALVVQAALAAFLNEGHFAAHVRRMRGLYAKRQAALLAAAARRLGGRLVVEAEEAGMQVAARLPVGADDVAASEALARSGVAAGALSTYALGRPAVRGLLLGYAGVPEREIGTAMQTVADVLARTP